MTGIQLDKIKFRGVIKSGKLTLQNEKYFRFHISKFKDCPVTIQVERIRTKKSQKQLGLYWGGWLPVICQTTGYTEEEQHEVFTDLFAPRVVKKWRGRERLVLKRMHTFTTGEMVEFLLKVEREAGELGIVLPTKDDYDVAPLLN